MMSGTIIEVDLHGLHPNEFLGLPLLEIIEQAWRSGASRLVLIHGHGFNRGLPDYYGTGLLGHLIRGYLKRDYHIGHFIKRRTIDCRNPGVTSVALQKNPRPVASSFTIESILPPVRREAEEAAA
jgi:hypothetical protein